MHSQIWDWYIMYMSLNNHFSLAPSFYMHLAQDNHVMAILDLAISSVVSFA